MDALLTVVKEMQIACRSLTRKAAFSVSASLIMAIGIALNIVAFSFYYHILVRPLPFRLPHQLYFVCQAGDTHRGAPGLSPAEYMLARDATAGIQECVVWTAESAVIETSRGNETAFIAVVSDNFFSALGIRSSIGTPLSQPLRKLNNSPTAVLSWRGWQRLFGGNPSAIGALIRVGERAYQVIGVAPAEVELPQNVDAWVTSSGEVPELRVGEFIPNYEHSKMRVLQTVVRGVPGVRPDDLVQFLHTAIAPVTPLDARNVVTIPADTLIKADARSVISLMAVCAIALQLTIILNLGTLYCVQIINRTQETATKLALGSSLVGICRSFWFESFLICCIASLFGILIAYAVQFSIVSLLRFHSIDLPNLNAVHFSHASVAYGLLLAVLCSTAFAVTPHVVMRRFNIAQLLRSDARSASTSPKIRLALKVLVGSQVVGCVVLIAITGCASVSFYSAERASWGLLPDGVTSLRISLGGQEIENNETRRRFLDNFSLWLGTTGALDVAYSAAPVGETWNRMPAAEPSKQAGAPAKSLVGYQVISPPFFKCLGIPLETGTVFQRDENSGKAHLCVVNRALERAFYPGSSAVGQILMLGSGEAMPHRIIGVCGDVKNDGPEAGIQPQVYVPYDSAGFGTSVFFYMKTSLAPSELEVLVRRELHRFGNSISLASVQPLNRLLQSPRHAKRTFLVILTIISVACLVISAVGVYAAILFILQQRVRELGLRLALGCPPEKLKQQLLVQHLVWLGAAVVIGCAIAGVATHALRAQIFDFEVVAIPVIASASTAILAVLAGALWIPVLRITAYCHRNMAR